MPTDEKPSKNEEEYFARQNAEAIKAIRAKLDAERAKAKANQPRNCPRDGTPLVEEHIEQVVLDRCPTCKGIWLDAGELEQLQQVNRSRGATGGVLSSLFRR